MHRRYSYFSILFLCSVAKVMVPTSNQNSENDQKPEKKRNVISFLKPLIISIRFLGIEIDPVQRVSKKSVFLVHLISFLILFLNASGNIYFTIVSLYDAINSDSFTSSEIWSLVIDSNSYNLSIIGSHGVFLIVTRQNKWKLLWNNLQKLGEDHDDFDRLISKCKRAVSIGIMFLLANFSWNFGNVILRIVLSDSARKRSLLTNLADAVAMLSEIFGFFGVVVFVIFGWITSVHFDHLQTQITSFSSNCINKQPPVQGLVLKKWRQTHVTLLELVSYIQRCFESLLLIWIVFVFINVISNSFYVVRYVLHYDSKQIGAMFMCLVLLIRNLTILAVLAVTPDILRQQSQSMASPLRMIEFEDPKLQHQLEIFTMEVMQSEIQITAMGFFPVDLTLFPKLVGTTLTYLIILFQHSNK